MESVTHGRESTADSVLVTVVGQQYQFSRCNSVHGGILNPLHQYQWSDSGREQISVYSCPWVQLFPKYDLKDAWWLCVWLILSENSRFSYCLQLKTLDSMLYFPVAFGYFSADVARWCHIKHTDSDFLRGQGVSVIFSLWIFIEIPNASLMNSLEKYDSLQLKLKSQFW